MVSLRRSVASSMVTVIVSVGAIKTRFFFCSAAYPPRGSGGALCTEVVGLTPDRFDQSVEIGSVTPVQLRVVKCGAGKSVGQGECECLPAQ